MKRRTIHPGIQGLYRRRTYACVLPDRGTISALPICEEQDVVISKNQTGRVGSTVGGTYGALYFTV